MSIELEDALRDLRHDIDTEMARLIRLGVPPWDAAIQARQRIERQRRHAQPACGCDALGPCPAHRPTGVE